MSTHLSPEAFYQLFKTFKVEAFRLETLPQYLVPEERAAWQAYSHGNRDVSTVTNEWFEAIAAAKRRGAALKRLRIHPLPLTDYLQFEIDCGYVNTAAAGEEIRLMSEENADEELKGNDFWLFDERTCVRMVYDRDGTYRRAEIADAHLLKLALEAREEAWALAVPLDTFLAEEDERRPTLI